MAPSGNRARRFFLALVGVAVTSAACGAGITSQVQLEQRLGALLPLEARFSDETGRVAPLRAFLSARPAIVVLSYFECPNLCGTVLSALAMRLQRIELSAGRDFDLLVVSIDPKDTATAAARKKQAYLPLYGRADATTGFHFLTAGQTEIASLTEAVGFHYTLDASSGQFAHPAGVVLVTPTGRVARYLPGVDFPERELKYGLIETSGNRIGSPADRLWLLCFHYDAATGRYGAAVANALRASGLLTVVVLAGAIAMWLRRERRALKVRR